MEGTAYCHGAATTVNGIVTGKGASFGIGLKTTAIVELTDEPGVFRVTIENDRDEDPTLSKCCVREVLRDLGLEKKYGATIRTRSDIPISRGLKSSSASANAVILATYQALGEEYEDIKVINMGVKASFEAKVTITGAYDDACATYFGGVVVTDNLNKLIIKQYSIDDDLRVLIHIPERKIRKSEVDVGQLSGIRSTVEKALDHTMRREYRVGMIMNGLSYGSAMGLDTEVTMMALRAGAVSAGISGTGPATVILCERWKEDEIIEALSDDRIIRTDLNCQKAGFE